MPAVGVGEIGESVVVLWSGPNGRVVCSDHGGYYLGSVLANRPNAKRVSTPLGSWHRMSDAEVADWLEFVASLSSVASPCEGCRSVAVS